MKEESAHRRMTPWIRLDVAVLTDAKLRRARARGLWPIVLLVLKQCGGVIPTGDLDAELLAQDLDGLLDAAGVQERLDALKREGLLIHGTYKVKVSRGEREITGWTTPHWKSFQPDERSRRGGPVGPQAAETPADLGPATPPAVAATEAVPRASVQPPTAATLEAPAVPDAVAQAAFRRASAIDLNEFLKDPESFGGDWASLGPAIRERVIGLWKRLPDTMATDGLARLLKEFGEPTMTEALRRMAEDTFTNPKPSDVRRRCEEIKRTQSRPGGGGQAPTGRFNGGNPIQMRPAGAGRNT